MKVSGAVMDKVERIAALRNEIEAQLLAGELAELDIHRKNGNI